MESSKLINFVEALENTGCNDNEKRKLAEGFIQEEKKNQGFVQAMMQIASNSEYAQGRSFDVNLAAAIQLKNMADYHWKHTTQEHINRPADFDDSDHENESGENILISQEDKEFVKAHIIQALVHSPSFGVLSQFEEIIYVVARYELPENWPNAIKEITELLNEQEETKVFAGLIALKEVVHKFEFEFKDRRTPLQEIVDNLFPKIEDILTNLIEIHADDAVRAKNIVIETFFLANNVKLCNRYKEPAKFDALINLVSNVFTQELPAELTQHTEEVDQIEKLTKSNEWKLKTNCIKFLNKIFTQLSDTSMVEEEDEGFSKRFVSVHAKNFIEISLSMIEGSLSHFMPNEILSFAIRIVSKTEKVPELFAHLRVHHEDILLKYSLPLLKLTPNEIEEFSDNPVSYIRSQYDISDTLNSAKNSAMDLITFFACYNEDEDDKGTPPYLEKYFNYLVQGLEEYQTQNNQDFRVKDSILLAFSLLNTDLKKASHLYESVELILKNHVYPELQGDNEMLKSRCLWLYGEFSLFVQDPEHAIKAVESVYKCLLDDCLPVKVFAGTSLHKISKIKDAKRILEPGIADIIAAYLKAMQEIDQDELVNALEEMVNLFEDKIEPFAFELIQELNIRFKKVVKGDDDCGESVLTANGCI